MVALKMVQSRSDLLRLALESENVTRCYLIASTFRSGSTYVAEALSGENLVGLDKEKFGECWDHINDSNQSLYSYFSDIAKTSADGTFCAKVMWPHKEYICRSLRIEDRWYYGFDQSFPNPHWILVTRKDKVRQAISFWRAKKTSRWHKYLEEDEPAITYSYDEVYQCLLEIYNHDNFWREVFKKSNRKYIEVEFEKFSELVNIDINAATSAVRKMTSGLSNSINPVSLRKISDESSEIYYKKFFKDLLNNNILLTIS